MMDYVTDVKPGISSEGYKDLIDDWFFEVHWKNDPNMPVCYKSNLWFKWHLFQF